MFQVAACFGSDSAKDGLSLFDDKNLRFSVCLTGPAPQLGCRFEPGVKYYGLKEGGVGLSPMKYTKHLISESVFDRLEEIKQRIIKGKIEITAFDYLKAQISEKSE